MQASYESSEECSMAASGASLQSLFLTCNSYEHSLVGEMLSSQSNTIRSDPSTGGEKNIMTCVFKVEMLQATQ